MRRFPEPKIEGSSPFQVDIFLFIEIAVSIVILYNLCIKLFLSCVRSQKILSIYIYIFQINYGAQIQSFIRLFLVTLSDSFYDAYRNSVNYPLDQFRNSQVSSYFDSRFTIIKKCTEILPSRDHDNVLNKQSFHDKFLQRFLLNSSCSLIQISTRLNSKIQRLLLITYLRFCRTVRTVTDYQS